MRRAQGRVRLGRARAWAQRGSGFPTKALALRVQHRPYMQPAWPPRPAAPCASRCAPRGLHCSLRPPPLAAALSRWRDLGRAAQGLPPACGARGPCASPLLQRPQGRQDPVPAVLPTLARTLPPAPAPASPPQDSHAHGFFERTSPRRITTLGSMTAGVCQVPGTVPGSPVHLRTSSENGAGPAPWRPGRRCQREGAARSCRQRAAEAPPAEPGSRSSALGLESAKPEFPDPAPHGRLNFQLLYPNQRGADSWQEFLLSLEGPEACLQ